jgi:hypothetical protein
VSPFPRVYVLPCGVGCVLEKQIVLLGRRSDSAPINPLAISLHRYKATEAKDPSLRCATLLLQTGADPTTSMWRPKIDDRTGEELQIWPLPPVLSSMDCESVVGRCLEVKHALLTNLRTFSNWFLLKGAPSTIGTESPRTVKACGLMSCCLSREQTRPYRYFQCC